MITILVPGMESYDEVNNEFITSLETQLVLEHSLISISKWESRWHKPFLANKVSAEKTTEELIDYIRCMTTHKVPDDNVYLRLTSKNIDDIQKYIDNPMTATKIYEEDNGKKSHEPTTSELIYYWMISLNIPQECERWHLNRLLTLVRVCSIKNAPPKKVDQNKARLQRAELNAQRRAEYNSKG